MLHVRDCNRGYRLSFTLGLAYRAGDWRHDLLLLADGDSVAMDIRGRPRGGSCGSCRVDF